MPAEMNEYDLEENLCKALLLIGVNVIHVYLHACHCVKRPDKMTIKFKFS